MATTPKYDREFHEIAAKCDVPREWFEMSTDGFVRVLAPRTATYDDMQCVLDELKAHQIPMKMGFVTGGN